MCSNGKSRAGINTERFLEWLKVEVICRKTMEPFFSLPPPPPPPHLPARLTRRHVSLAGARKSGSGVANYVSNSRALFKCGWKPKLPLGVLFIFPPSCVLSLGTSWDVLWRPAGFSLINEGNTTTLPPPPPASCKAAGWQLPLTSSSPPPPPRSSLPAEDRSDDGAPPTLPPVMNR